MQVTVQQQGVLSVPGDPTGTPIHKVTIASQHSLTLVRELTLIGTAESCKRQAVDWLRLELLQLTARPGVTLGPDTPDGFRIDPRAFGYAIEGPGGPDDGKLNGRYWWTRSRDGTQHQASAADFATPEEALAGARAAFYSEIVAVFKPKEQS